MTQAADTALADEIVTMIFKRSEIAEEQIQSLKQRQNNCKSTQAILCQIAAYEAKPYINWSLSKEMDDTGYFFFPVYLKDISLICSYYFDNESGFLFVFIEAIEFFNFDPKTPNRTGQVLSKINTSNYRIIDAISKTSVGENENCNDEFTRYFKQSVYYAYVPTISLLSTFVLQLAIVANVERYLELKLSRTKEGGRTSNSCHRNTVIMGHIGYGKSNNLIMTSQDNYYLNYGRYRRVEKLRWMQIVTAQAVYKVDKYNQMLDGRLGHADFWKSMIAGVSRMHGAIIMERGRGDLMPEMRTHILERILLARYIGVRAPVVSLNKVDQGDDDLRELVELLSAYEFPGKDTAITAGSAREAHDDKMAKEESLERTKAVGNYVLQPGRPNEKNFLMSFENVLSISGGGTVITSWAENGKEIVGINEAMMTVCTDVEMFRKLLRQSEAGGNVGVLLCRAMRNEVERGEVLAAPGAITQHKKFKPKICTRTKEEGVYQTSFFMNYRLQSFYCMTEAVGVAALVESTESTTPHVNVTNVVIKSMHLSDGDYIGTRQ